MFVGIVVEPMLTELYVRSDWDRGWLDDPHTKSLVSGS